MLGQPVALGVQRLGDPGQLLERREVPVADDGRGRDREVDGAEQLVVELGLLAGEVRRRRRRQPDHVRRLARGGQLAERGAHDVAPQRGEVVALVEHDRADLGGGEPAHALARGDGEQVRQPDALVAALGDLALDRGADPGELAAAALGGRVGRAPARGLAVDRLGVAAGRGGALGGPARRGQPPERDLGVVDLRQRLVGEAQQLPAGRGGVGGDQARVVGERARQPHPLHLHRAVGHQHERTAADPAGELDPEQRLARAGRRDDVRPPPAGLAVALEGRQRERLVVAPPAVEAQVLQHQRADATAPARLRQALAFARVRAPFLPPRCAAPPCACAWRRPSSRRPGASAGPPLARSSRSATTFAGRRSAPARPSTAGDPRAESALREVARDALAQPVRVQALEQDVGLGFLAIGAPPDE